MNEFERNIPPQSEIDNDDLETGEVLTNEQAEQSDVESESFGMEEAAIMEQEVVQSSVDSFREQFKDKLDNLTATAKQKVAQALMVVFLATTIAGMVSEKSYAADLDQDKDQQEKVGDYTEPDLEKMLGFEVKFMTEDEAKEVVANFTDSLKTSGPEGERLVTHEIFESEGDFNKDTQGELPTEAENVIVRGGIINTVYEAQGESEDFYNNWGSYEEVVSVENVEPIGEPFEISGMGENSQDAIRDALQNAGQRIEISVESQMTSQTIESEDTFQNETSKQLQGTYDKAIDSYKVLEVNEVEQNGIKFFEAKVNVQPGQVLK